MIAPGDRIGDWIVERALGAGGMGTVFRCRNALAERILAAVKVVQPAGEDFRERFVREVEALERLQHPAIVRVKGWGDAPVGLWLAMDLVDGEELGARLARGPLSPDEARTVFADLLDGLAHAHERGVFHRDIKPANLLITPDGRGRLVDFGIAAHGGRTRLSVAGVVPGTPAYLAPEVFGGTPDPRALDVYALGQVLCEALTGTDAFPDPGSLTTTQRIAHVAGSKLRHPALDPGPGVPEHLRQLVRRATDPDPARRATDLHALRRALDGEILPDPESASVTLSFDLDGLMGPDLPTAPTPSILPGIRPPAPRDDAPPPAREPPAPTRSPAVARGLALAVLLAVPAVFLAGLLWPRGPSEVAVAVTGLPRDVPVLLRVDGATTEPERPLRWTVPPGSRLDVRAGDCSAGCGPCCVCAEHLAPTDVGFLDIALEPPATSRTLRIRVLPDDPTAPPEVQVDGAPVQPAQDGSFARQVPLGPVTVRVTRGICGADPSLCAHEQVVDVPCGREPLSLEVPLVPPAPPAPTPRARPLLGRRVRLLYPSQRQAVAAEAAKRLERDGATVELLTSHERAFLGRLIHWDPALASEAATIERRLVDLGIAKPEVAREPTAEPIDYAVWLDIP